MVGHTLTLKIGRPIQKIEVLNEPENEVRNEVVSDEPNSTAGHRRAEQIGSKPSLKVRKSELPQICQTLNGLVNKLNQLYDKLFIEHREEIAKLSIEIARKILVQKVQDGDYQIEAIVKEALKSAPSHKDLVVHLNPNDFAEWQKLQEGNSSDAFEGLKLVPDSSIGAAECLLESPKGTIESKMEEHLERISRALKSGA